jgi:hypothetical protein
MTGLDYLTAAELSFLEQIEHDLAADGSAARANEQRLRGAAGLPPVVQTSS